MIEVNYNLSVDMGSETMEYHPDPKLAVPLNNILKISGPNSCGKSTLMNIVAMATYGLKNDSISKDIKVRLDELLNSDYKELDFNIQIYDPVSKVRLRASKERGFSDIKLYESVDGSKDQILPADIFAKKYKLIYDIPENPMGRINELVGELHSWQKNYLDDSVELMKSINQLHSDVKRTRDPELIKETESIIRDLHKEYDKLKENDFNDEIESLQKLYHASLLEDRHKKKKQAEDYLKPLLPYLKDNVTIDPNSTYRNNFIKDKTSIDSIIKIIVSNSYGLKDIDSVVNNVGSYQINVKTDKNEFDSYCSEIERLISLLSSLKIPESDPQERIICDLLNLLERYEKEVPFVQGLGNISTVIKTLKETQKSTDSGLPDRIRKLRKQIEPLHAAVDSLKTNYSGMSRPTPSVDSNHSRAIEAKKKYDDCSSELDSSLSICKKYDLNLNNYSKKITIYSDNLSGKYKHHTLKQLKQAIDDLQKTTTSKEQLEAIKERITSGESRLEHLKSAETHKYADKIDQIIKLSNEAKSLRDNLYSASEKLKLLKNKDYSKCNNTDEYFESVWRYLGSRLQVVRHLDNTYPVEGVNLIDGKIICGGGIIIRINDMGTGQGQLTYLLGLLSSNDDRRIIAMFDEVAAMSPGTLEVVMNRFEELQDEGKLMLGLAVMPSDELTVIQYGRDVNDS